MDNKEQVILDHNSCPVCALRAFMVEVIKEAKQIIQSGGTAELMKRVVESNENIKDDVDKQLGERLKLDSTPRLGETLAFDVKARGWMRPDFEQYTVMIDGVVRDATLEAKIPIGSSLPAFQVRVDTCLKCGCLYAVKIIRTEAKKSVVPLPGNPKYT